VFLIAQTQTQPPDLEAFCMTCPAAEEVTAMLQPFGFELTFQMDACIYPAYSATPDLPAQYHYRTKHGTEVIYLAGHDADTDGLRLPDHASRFWLYPGADLDKAERVAPDLARRWRLTWRRVNPVGPCERAA
jgi:hypothetical protein